LPMPRQDEHLPDQIERGGAGLGFWFFVESLGSMSSTGEMSRRLRIKFEGAIYHVMASASPSPTGRWTPADHGTDRAGNQKPSL